MQLTDYFSKTQNDNIIITPEQASQFAKSVAGDFNPLHNPDAKRFCVPGDLLFSLVLNQLGLSEKMHVSFLGMVRSDTPLHFNNDDAQHLSIEDATGKPYLSVEREGETTRDAALIQDLTCGYVQFSGHTFPHVLVPLMREEGVMVNPDRPLVIYEDMSIDLDHLDFTKPELKETYSRLDVEGKRGKVSLEFEISAQGKVVGHGRKNLVISGLRPYEEGKIHTLVNDYEALKTAYTGAK